MTIAIAEVPVDIEAGHNAIEIRLRAPGIVRAASFWHKSPKVLGSASMRAVEKVAMPLLFVECSPTGELEDRAFVFLSSGQPYTPREGLTAVHRATAVGLAGALHVYELVCAHPSAYDCAHCYERRCWACDAVTACEVVKTGVRFCPRHRHAGERGLPIEEE